jgi:hypothetical protein
MFNFRKNKLTALVALSVFMSTLANAGPKVYKYVDPDTGITTYTNFRLPPGQRPMIPAVPVTRTIALTAPARERPYAARIARPKEPRPVANDASFPTISAGTQRERDSERLTIIEEELRAEQTALDEAVAKDAAADVIRRYEANIAALQREVDRLKDGRMLRTAVKRKPAAA